ncbi:amidase signature enzyme [Apiospora hydei]|uniref:Amidase signature enzyme n=1 Tax=Apiospora hydei TaxID=1337664 RepID=A0ABR1UTV3_9PEZI
MTKKVLALARHPNNEGKPGPDFQLLHPLCPPTGWRFTAAFHRWRDRAQDDREVPRATTVITLGSRAYAIQSTCDFKVPFAAKSAQLKPLACLALPNSTDQGGDLEKEHSHFLENDEFCNSFFETVLLITDKALEKHACNILSGWGCTRFKQISTKTRIPPGPYFYSSSGLFKAWRLFPDDQNAFILSTIPSQHNPQAYEPLNAAAYGSSSLCVAVPSRLPFKTEQKKPLSGWRVAVKDLYHLNGVPTGCGNRAFRVLHSETRASSSSYVQLLIDSGCVIVGKTKTVEFGASQEVTGDWSDYFYPFNARGDGYLAATGSSTGSASSLAQYPWLDITLGTDSGGSIRDPAVANGVYGFRPSHDGKPISDIFLPCAEFHTPGFLGRSSDAMLGFGRVWLQNAPILPPSSRDTEPRAIVNCLTPWRPVRILLLEDYRSDRDAVQNIADNWVASLARWLGAERVLLSIGDLWDETKPEADNKGFYETFSNTFIDITYSEYWTYLSNFRKEYKERYNSDPYVCKVTKYLWDKGRMISDVRKQELLAEVAMHNKWFLEHVLNDNSSIIVVPRYSLAYRDEYLPYPPEDRIFEGFDSNLHASFCGLPNIIVPVGQCAYMSKISGNQEYFPVSLSIIAPRGMDIGLLSLVDDYLKENQRPTSVLTGPTAFDPLLFQKNDTDSVSRKEF